MPVVGWDSVPTIARTHDPDNPETGERGQYQQPLVIYASGERAGIVGEAEITQWREAAIRSGVLRQELSSPRQVVGNKG